MRTEASNPLFSSDLWRRALESYAKFTQLTIRIFDVNGSQILDPVHASPLFQLFEETTGYDPGLFMECAGRCLSQTINDRRAVIVSEFCGLSVIGTSLALDEQIIGAAVGGYVLVDFFQRSEAQRLAQNSGINFEQLWRLTREERPVSKQRLLLNGALLQVLGDALLRENSRTRQYEQAAQALQQTATALQESVAEREQQAADLKRLNEDLTHFAYAASHDLQEPLRMVRSYTELLSKEYRGKLDKDADQYIDYASEGAQRMELLLTGIREYWQATEGGQEHHATVDLDEVLKKVLLNLQEAIKQSGAVVTHDPLPTVWADEILLVQLFQNLLGNAIKYRSKKPPRVHVSAEKNDKREWVFSVKDNGIGIDPRYAEKIFVIFSRLNRRKYPGSGIGLALCRKIAERLGGRIWVESKLGRGSVFKFTLPARSKPWKKLQKLPAS